MSSNQETVVVSKSSAERAKVFDALALFIISTITSGLPIYLGVIWMVYPVLNQKFNLILAFGLSTLFAQVFNSSMETWISFRKPEAFQSLTIDSGWKKYWDTTFPYAAAFTFVYVVCHLASGVFYGA